MSEVFAFMMESIAASMTSPGFPPLVCWASTSQRAFSGTQNTPSRLYSSTSSRKASIRVSGTPSASTSARICSRRSAKESDTYLRNTIPSTKSLYWAASIEPRSLSAAFHSVSCRSLVLVMPGSVTWPCFFRGGMVSLLLAHLDGRRLGEGKGPIEKP